MSSSPKPALQLSVGVDDEAGRNAQNSLARPSAAQPSDEEDSSKSVTVKTDAGTMSAPEAE